MECLLDVPDGLTVNDARCSSKRINDCGGLLTDLLRVGYFRDLFFSFSFLTLCGELYISIYVPRDYFCILMRESILCMISSIPSQRHYIRLPPRRRSAPFLNGHLA